MTEIEQKALALVNEVRAERGQDVWRDVGDRKGYGIVLETLCRAIEQHEAFRREVSEAVVAHMEADYQGFLATFSRFILPDPQPDPLSDLARALGVERDAVAQAVEQAGVSVGKGEG